MWAIRNGRQSAEPSAIVNVLWRVVRSGVTAVLDALPPYRWVEGRLVAKEGGRNGSYYLLVDEEMVQVDWLAFETLMVGEALRIRCTRDFKAINIDRLVP